MSTDATRAAIRGLYAIADSAYLTPDAFVPAVQATLDGGARIIQYRNKSSDAATHTRIARDLNALCQRHAVPFLINDDVALAAAACT